MEFLLSDCSGRYISAGAPGISKDAPDDGLSKSAPMALGCSIQP